jgi:hypothetical protein
MTIDYREFFAERVEPFFVEYVQPVVRKIGKTVVSAVKFSFGAALTLAASGFLIIAGYLFSLTDAAMRLANGDQPPSDTRDGLLLLSAIALGALIWGLHILHDWRHPHGQDANAAARVADLEIKLRAAEAELIEAEQFEDEAAEAVQFAEETKWAINAIAAVADVFKIDGVLEAARRACRKALHPDSHPGASADEIHDLTERFQRAEAVFSNFSN